MTGGGTLLPPGTIGRFSIVRLTCTKVDEAAKCEPEEQCRYGTVPAGEPRLM